MWTAHDEHSSMAIAKQATCLHRQGGNEGVHEHESVERLQALEIDEITPNENAWFEV